MFIFRCCPSFNTSILCRQIDYRSLARYKNLSAPLGNEVQQTKPTFVPGNSLTMILKKVYAKRWEVSDYLQFNGFLNNVYHCFIDQYIEIKSLQ